MNFEPVDLMNLVICESNSTPISPWPKIEKIIISRLFEEINNSTESLHPGLKLANLLLNLRSKKLQIQQNLRLIVKSHLSIVTDHFKVHHL